ncbi:MAG: nucleotide exchange factor GrpE [Proteobacteria bacterium]|nr:nucleotide exchange factor GrpE [Pseudomonadota bacterium]
MSADEAPKSEAPMENPAPEAERIATLERENADLKDRLLRALAEMENLRRRAERELQDGRAYAITKFAGDIIGTADNLRRALDTAPKAAEGEAEDEALAPFKALIDGVELTERELLKALERHGVKKRNPKGEKFDPHRDQAMFEVPDESVFAGTVVEVVQPGYVIGERVLRPAMVGVSRGGPARPVEAAPAAEPPPAPKPEGAKPHIDKRA